MVVKRENSYSIYGFLFDGEAKIYQVIPHRWTQGLKQGRNPAEFSVSP
jgi:hypothetical protein